MKWLEELFAGLMGWQGGWIRRLIALSAAIVMLLGAAGAESTAFADDGQAAGGNVAVEQTDTESATQDAIDGQDGVDAPAVADETSGTTDASADVPTSSGVVDAASGAAGGNGDAAQGNAGPAHGADGAADASASADAPAVAAGGSADAGDAAAGPVQPSEPDDSSGAAHVGADADADDADKTPDADDVKESDDADAADDDDPIGERIMLQRFTYNRKTVRRAAQSGTAPEPDHAKRIVYNGKGKYTLNLDVVGKNTRETHEVTSQIEVVLVLDTSGSMNDCMDGSELQQGESCPAGNPARLTALKTAANSFIDATDAINRTIADDNDKVRIGIARFGRNSGKVSNLTSDTGNLKTSVSNLTAGGATPADQGMKSAQGILQSSRSGAKRIVIFFADGVPTTLSQFSANVANSAVQTARTLKSAGALIYSIGIFDGANPELTQFASSEQDKANQFMHAISSNYPNAAGYSKRNWGGGSNAGYYKATNSAEDLKRIFDDIQQEITTGSAYSAVSITDELSEYAQVDGVTWNNDDMRTIDGIYYYRVTGGVAMTATNLPAGVAQPKEGSDYTLWYSDDGANGQDVIRAEFAADYELAHDATYTLSYGIVPADAAYESVDMIAGGISYDATGDADTGATSAGKPGFRSNDKAQVCYTFDGQSGCADYRHPVLQVPSANVTVTKHWEGGRPADGTTLRINFVSEGISRYGKDLSSDDDWTYTFRSVMPDDYTVTEGAADGYHAKDGISSRPLNITTADMWDAFDQGRTATYAVDFTNVRDTVALADGVPVSKTVLGADHADDFDFELADATTAAQRETNTGTLTAGMADGMQTVAIGGLKDGKAKEARFDKDSAGDRLTFATPLDGGTDTYTFAVRERQPQSGTGWRFDRSEYHVTVTVARNAAGAVEARVTRIVQVKDMNGRDIAEGERKDVPVAAFTNRYQAVSALPLSGTTDGRRWTLIIGGTVLALLVAGMAGIAISGRRRLQ